MKPTPVVGQKLYSLRINNYGSDRNKEQELTAVKVTSVGRKYFKCSQFSPYSFEVTYHIDTWKEKTDYSPTSKLYISPKEWEDEKEEKRICEIMGKYFQYGNNYFHIPIDDLKLIEKIILKSQPIQETKNAS